MQSRYYNPVWGRFINADGYVSTGQGFVGNNMFAYCGNNPVMYSDFFGESLSYAVQASVISGAALLDGPLPFADIFILVFILEYGNSSNSATYYVNPEVSVPNVEVAEKNNSGAKSKSGKKKKVSKKSQKERSTEKPSWVNKDMVDPNLSAQQNATNMLNSRFGPGNWDKGPRSDFNILVKWMNRGGLLKIVSTIIFPRNVYFDEPIAWDK